MMGRLTARLRREDGVAAIVAVMVLAVSSAVAGTVFMQAVYVSGTSERDDSAKRAFQAAEAGMNVALHRLNMVQPTSSQCITTTAATTVVAAPESSGWCAKTVEESLGDNQRFTYRVSRVLTSADTCAGKTLGGEVAERCIAAVGTVNGVRRRVQGRVAAADGEKLFKYGLLGKDGVTVNNNAQINGGLASNGAIVVGNKAIVTGTVEVGPSGPQPVGVSSYQRSPTPFVLAPIDFGNSAGTDDDADCDDDNGDGTVANDNCRLYDPPGVLGPLDSLVNASYSPSDRHLNLLNGGSITLGGGTYNFCKITMGNSASINIAAGATVRIYLDSPERQGSRCPAGSGTMVTGNNATFSNPSGDPTKLQVYVYGSTTGQHVVDLPNNIDFAAAIYAPNSAVTMKNNGAITGGITASTITFKNDLTFNWDERVNNLSAKTVLVHYRTAWIECNSHSPSGDPAVGCL